MARKNAKRLFAMATSIVMVTGMLAIPAYAGHYELAPITKNAFTQNFDNVTIDRGNSGEYVAITDNIDYKADCWNWDAPTKVTTQLVEDTTNQYMQVAHGYNNGSSTMMLKLDGPKTLNDSSVIDISFDYMAVTAGSMPITFGFTPTKYVFCEPINGGKNVNIYAHNGMIYIGENKIGLGLNNSFTMTEGSWYTIKAKLRYSDADANGDQTVELTVVDKAAGTALGNAVKCKVDALPTGQVLQGWDYQHDGTFDKYDIIDALYIKSGQVGDDLSTYALDNLVVDYTQDQNVFVSDSTSVKYEQNFDKVDVNVINSSYNTAAEGNGKDIGVEGMRQEAYWTNAAVQTIPVEGRGNVLSTTMDQGDAKYRINLPQAVEMGKNDEFVVSYDYLSTGLTGGCYFSINHRDEFGSYKYHQMEIDSLGWIGDKTGVATMFAIVNDALKPGDGGWSNTSINITENKWYNLTHVLKNSDPAYGGEQTLTTIVTDLETNTVIGRFLGQVDANYVALTEEEKAEGKEADSTYDKFDSIDCIYIKLNNNNGNANYLDNIKISTNRAGYEVDGTPNSTNSFFFSGSNAIKLNYATNTSYTKADTHYVIIAQYMGNKLIATSAAPAGHTGDVTITPEAEADTIKAFIWDGTTLDENVEVFTLTRN